LGDYFGEARSLPRVESPTVDAWGREGRHGHGRSRDVGIGVTPFAAKCCDNQAE
jgi:hypothetical protein